MSHLIRYSSLREALLPYQDIWQNEIMLGYPSPLKDYPDHWIESLSNYLSPDDTTLLLQGQGWQKLPQDLNELYRQLRQETLCPTAPPCVPIAEKPQTWVHIIPKKKKEIAQLAPFIAQHMRMRGLTRIVDIGGGQGHLAQTLAHHYELPVTSLDYSLELQQIGERWQKKKWPQSQHNISFKCHEVIDDDPTYFSLLDQYTLTTGLHTCGDLAIWQLRTTVRARASVVNLPCCYYKLELKNAQLSSVAHQNPIPWNLYALTLATSAHDKVSHHDVSFRNQVKLYRYCLHFLLHDELGMTGPVRLGSCPTKLYYGPFAQYVRQQMQVLNRSISLSDDELEAYVKCPSRKALINRMLAAGVIREIFARPLELSLLTDRALWLEEQGFECQILEIFPSQVSPRNLALVAHPN